MTLGEKIRALRIKNNMTMEDLAKEIGVQRSAVNKYEKGIVVNLKRSTLSSLCRVFNVPSSYLLDDDDDEVLSSDELLLVNTYRALPAKGKSYLMEQATIASVMFGEKSESDAQIG